MGTKKSVVKEKLINVIDCTGDQTPLVAGVVADDSPQHVPDDVYTLLVNMRKGLLDANIWPTTLREYKKFMVSVVGNQKLLAWISKNPKEFDRCVLFGFVADHPQKHLLVDSSINKEKSNLTVQQYLVNFLSDQKGYKSREEIIEYLHSLKLLGKHSKWDSDSYILRLLRTIKASGYKLVHIRKKKFAIKYNGPALRSEVVANQKSSPPDSSVDVEMSLLQGISTLTRGASGIPMDWTCASTKSCIVHILKKHTLTKAQLLGVLRSSTFNKFNSKDDKSAIKQISVLFNKIRKEGIALRSSINEEGKGVYGIERKN